MDLSIHLRSPSRSWRRFSALEKVGEEEDLWVKEEMDMRGVLSLSFTG